MGKISEWADDEAAERAKDDAKRGITRTAYGIMRTVGGVHPEFVDYRCTNCDRVTEDVHFSSKSAVTDTITCSCGSEAVKVILRTNFINLSISSLYGRLQPALGYSEDPDDQINNYGDKQRVLRKHNLTESNDPVGGSRKRSEELKHEAYKREKERKARPPSSWVAPPSE